MKLVVLYSFILAIVHSILFYGQKLGISVFLFTVTGLFFFIHLLKKYDKIKNKKALLISIPILILSTTYFIFNNTLFNILNIIVILFLFLIMTVVSILGQLYPGRLIENFFVLFLGPLEELPNSVKEVKNCFIKKQEKEEKNEKKELVKKILKGVLISLPIVILVLILLSSADEMFASLFKNIFKHLADLLDMESVFDLFARIVIIVIITLYFVCMAIKIMKNQFVNTKGVMENKIKIEGTTTATLLTILNIIYLAFSIIQIIHLKTDTISNYANYARTGFFQLMTVSFINFVVILVTKNNKKEIETNIKKYEKIMNVLLAVFTVVILITSIVRMNMYETAYGFTYLRIIVNIIQITELLLIIPTIIYIIKDKFNLIKWALIISLGVYIIANFVNIDYIIAKGNIDRYFKKGEERKNIDLYYLEENTSTDALIEITRLLETKDEDLKIEVNNYLYDKYMELMQDDVTFQNFNLSRKRAKEELEKLNLHRIGEYLLDYNDLRLINDYEI